MHWSDAKGMMGKYITVTKLLKRRSTKKPSSFFLHRVQWVESDCAPITGWVVGVTWKCNGVINYSYDFEFRTTRFNESSRVFCVLLKTHPRSRGLIVPYEYAKQLCESQRRSDADSQKTDKTDGK